MKEASIMDEYIRKLERSGLNQFQILSTLFDKADETGRERLYKWAEFHNQRHKAVNKSSDFRTSPYSLRTDADIKQSITIAIRSRESMRNNITLLNEGVYRNIVVYASVECCKDEDCELCAGENIVHTKKVLFPDRELYEYGNI